MIIKFDNNNNKKKYRKIFIQQKIANKMIFHRDETIPWSEYITGHVVFKYQKWNYANETNKNGNFQENDVGLYGSTYCCCLIIITYIQYKYNECANTRMCAYFRDDILLLFANF